MYFIFFLPRLICVPETGTTSMKIAEGYSPFMCKVPTSYYLHPMTWFHHKYRGQETWYFRFGHTSTHRRYVHKCKTVAHGSSKIRLRWNWKCPIGQHLDDHARGRHLAGSGVTTTNWEESAAQRLAGDQQGCWNYEYLSVKCKQYVWHCIAGKVEVWTPSIIIMRNVYTPTGYASFELYMYA